MFDSKALGKLGNIAAETLCFLSIFPCLPTSGNIVGETKFASQLLRKQCFLVRPRVFKCLQHEKHCFPDWECSNNVLRL